MKHFRSLYEVDNSKKCVNEVSRDHLRLLFRLPGIIHKAVHISFAESSGISDEFEAFCTDPIRVRLENGLRCRHQKLHNGATVCCTLVRAGSQQQNQVLSSQAHTHLPAMKHSYVCSSPILQSLAPVERFLEYSFLNALTHYLIFLAVSKQSFPNHSSPYLYVQVESDQTKH